jgi:hypothetical protein
VILAVLAEGMFEYNLGDSEVLTLFLSAIACGYAAIQCEDAQPVKTRRRRAALANSELKAVSCEP